MNNKVFVGNLPWAVTTSDLSKLLGDFGFTFRSVKVIQDQDTGRSRGFAFVEFATEAEAFRAIQVLSGYIIEGRAIVANEALPREREGVRSRNKGGGLSSGGQGPWDNDHHDRRDSKPREKDRRSHWAPNGGHRDW